jgi:hypothetical protein
MVMRGWECDWCDDNDGDDEENDDHNQFHNFVCTRVCVRVCACPQLRELKAEIEGIQRLLEKGRAKIQVGGSLHIPTQQSS